MFVEFLSTELGKFIAVMLVAAVPVIELRGAVPLALHSFEMDWAPALIAAVIGNMLPVPFILLFLRRVFQWMSAFKYTAPMVRWFERKAHLKGRTVRRYAKWGLFILVAIPLPGTGAWTGSLVAALLDMRIKIAFPVIMAGVIAAGIVVTLLSMGVIHVFA